MLEEFPQGYSFDYKNTTNKQYLEMCPTFSCVAKRFVSFNCPKKTNTSNGLQMRRNCRKKTEQEELK